MTFYLSFDPPVSVNKMYIRARSGKVILSDAARNWKEYAHIMAISQWEGKKPLEGALSVTYRFFGMKADWDNPCKILGDAMNKIIYHDDRQIIQAHIYMHREELSDPRVDVEILVLW